MGWFEHRGRLPRVRACGAIAAFAIAALVLPATASATVNVYVDLADDTYTAEPTSFNGADALVYQSDEPVQLGLDASAWSDTEGVLLDRFEFRADDAPGWTFSPDPAPEYPFASLAFYAPNAMPRGAAPAIVVRAWFTDGTFEEARIVLLEDDAAPVSSGAPTMTIDTTDTMERLRPITLPAAIDAPAGVVEYWVESQTAPWNGSTCGRWGDWAYLYTYLPENRQAYFDSNTCVRVRGVARDRIGNEGPYLGVTEFLVDNGDSTWNQGSSPIPFYIRDSVTIDGTFADADGVVAVSAQIGARVLCVDTTAPFDGCVWDSNDTPDGPASIHLFITDGTGDVTRLPIKPHVDNTAPVATTPCTPGSRIMSGTGGVHDGVVWAGAGTGSVMLGACVTDDGPGQSGIVEFNNVLALPTGWTTTHAHVGATSVGWPVTWTSNAPEPNVLTTTIRDQAGNETEWSWTIRTDRVAPSAGTLAAGGPLQLGASGNPTLAATWPGTDDHGIWDVRLERNTEEIPLGATCSMSDNFWDEVHTYASGPGAGAAAHQDTLGVRKDCAKYRLVVRDLGGNRRETLLNDWFLKDADAPRAEPTFLTTGLSGEIVSSGQLFMRPDTAGTASISVRSRDAKLFGSVASLQSSSSGWTLPAPQSLPLNATITLPLMWGTTGVDGAVALHLVDSVGNVTDEPLPITADDVGPTLPPPQRVDATGLNARGFTDASTNGGAGSGVATVRLESRVAPLSAGACGTWGAWTTLSESYTATDLRLQKPDLCLEYRSFGTDRLGNASTSGVLAVTTTATAPPVPTTPMPTNPTPTTPSPTTPPRVLNGTARADRLQGTPRADTIRGNGGADRLFGGAGADRLDGGAGNDTIDCGIDRALDLVFGGAGRDVIRCAGASRDIVNCGPGFDTAYVDRFDRVIGCERVIRSRR